MSQNFKKLVSFSGNAKDLYDAQFLMFFDLSKFFGVIKKVSKIISKKDIRLSTLNNSNLKDILLKVLIYGCQNVKPTVEMAIFWINWSLHYYVIST